MGLKFGEIDGGKGSIEVKIQSLRVASLTVSQPSELFGITEEKFDLKPSDVVGHDQLGIQGFIGGKKDNQARLVGMGEVDEQTDTNDALERDVEQGGGIKQDVGFNFTEGFKAGEVGEVNFSSVAPPASTRFLRSGVEKAQVGIRPQFADQVQTQAADSVHKFPFRVQSVKDSIPNRGRPVRFRFPQMIQIVINSGECLSCGWWIRLDSDFRGGL